MTSPEVCLHWQSIILSQLSDMSALYATIKFAKILAMLPLYLSSISFDPISQNNMLIGQESRNDLIDIFLSHMCACEIL